MAEVLTGKYQFFRKIEFIDNNLPNIFEKMATRKEQKTMARGVTKQLHHPTLRCSKHTAEVDVIVPCP